MSNLLRTNAIASVAYRTMRTDGGVSSIIKKKNLNKGISDNVKVYSKEQDSNIKHKTATNQSRPKRGNQIHGRKTEGIWPENETFLDTSGRYRRNYCHMGLWSRISRESGGSLPKPIHFVSREEIESEDRDMVKRYVTSSRSCRKCIFTIFTTCSKMAARSIGFFKDCAEQPYRCKPILQSVHELGKNTHAGTDTLGKKNDPEVQFRVTQQLKDLFKRPNSYKFFNKPLRTSLDSAIDKMYSLPELIFHRFQAVYEKEKDVCNEKSRVVWCVPYLIVALENMYFGKIIESVKSKMYSDTYSIYPIGLTNYQTGQRSVKSLRDTFYSMRNPNYKIYSLDFSKFDSTIPNWAKDIFFAIVRSVSEYDAVQDKIFNYLRIYIKYTPFVYKDKVLFKEKGISSGLLITNLFDTWWNLTLHYFVMILMEYYPDQCDDVMFEKLTFDKMYMNPDLVKEEILFDEPLVRVMGDDSIFLADEYTFVLLQKVCRILGMKVTVKHITEKPDDDIFFLGRYWNVKNRPFQTEEYIALRITYTRWYDDRAIPFELEDLHLNRILSICLPLIGGKEFLDKYLFDYGPYKDFKESRKGFIYMKDFIEDTFRYTSKQNALNVDSY